MIKTPLGILSAIVLFVSVTSSSASEIRVDKVSGNRAIVTFPKGETPEAGKLYKIGGDDGDSGPRGSATRDYVIGMRVSFSSLETSTQTGGVNGVASTTSTTTSFRLSGSFGWNFGYVEVGPEISIASTSSTGTSATSAFLLGPFVDLDFIKNKSGSDVIPGISTDGGYLSSRTSGQTTTSSGFQIEGGFFCKFYIIGQSTAMRADLDFQYQNLSIQGVSVSVSGPVFKVGLSQYF